jgi:hypothetical protein
MYEQAYVLAGLLKRSDVQKRLDKVFRGEIEQDQLVDPETGSAA